MNFFTYKIAIFLWVAASALSKAHASDVDLYVLQLEAVANSCKGACVDKCATEANKIRQLDSLSGNAVAIKQSMMNCYSVTAMNRANSKNPHLMPLIMTASQLKEPTSADTNSKTTTDFKAKAQASLQQAIAKQNHGQTGGSKQASSAPIDANFRDEDGSVNMDKIIAIYQKLATYCESAPSTMQYSCNIGCKQGLENLNQANSQFKSNGEVQPAMLVMSKSYTSNLGCPMQTKLALQGEIENNPLYLAVLEAGKALEAGEWPPEPELTLDLAFDEPSQKPADVTASVTAATAISDLSFEQAQQLLKGLDDYKRLEKAVNKNKFSLLQLRKTVAKLAQQKASVPADKWQKKALQIGEAGIQRELYDALNQTCDENYLKQYRHPSGWTLPNYSPDVYGNRSSKAQQMEYAVPVQYLQRLCFAEQFATLKPQFDAAQNPQQLADLAQIYVADAAVTDRTSYCLTCVPGRGYLRPNLWQPEWVGYSQQRQADFNLAKQQLAEARKEQVAEQAKLEQAEKQRQEVLAKEKEIEKIIAMVNAEYPVAVDIAKAPSWLTNNGAAVNYQRKVNHVTGEFASRAIKLAQPAFMYDAVNTNSNSGFSDQIALFSSSSLFGLSACIDRKNLLETFLSNPKRLSGEQFLLLTATGLKCSLNLVQSSSIKKERQLQLQAKESLPKDRQSKIYEGQMRHLLSQIQDLLSKRLQAKGIRFINGYDGNSLFQIGERMVIANYNARFKEIVGTDRATLLRDKDKRFTQLQQQAKNKSLPSGKFNYLAQEQHVIASYVKQQGWHCDLLNENYHQHPLTFMSALKKCGEAFGDVAFVTFTERYQQQYRNHLQNGI
ncbi:hypothetical protein K0504_16560 [Neiella marina]|uniref:Uncharacterized protein n=1 Tax=Neiella holothuriorum TaxID=2870530 RepID=A0ABS7ELU4_9GAMM|nr:hypothetical protein [Neiella holothuriorum]MBW8192652.1 hypothetical protein [Neiella holothuriorum]